MCIILTNFCLPLQTLIFIRQTSLSVDARTAQNIGFAGICACFITWIAWFVCFAPYENPEITVACFIPNGYSGSEASQAPRDFIGWYMEQKTLRAVDLVLPVGNTLGP